ncbi:MAG: thiamine phosphate synthase [Chthoniobacterales bacterium]
MNSAFRIPHSPFFQAKLYAILDLGYVEPRDAVEMTGRLLAARVDVLQLRAKNFPPGEIAALAREIVSLCHDAGVPFILNDFPHLVPETGADGVHIGQDDGPLDAARAAAGPGKIVGRSTHSIAQARAAWAEGADYIGFGPLFATPTKPDYTPIGLADIAVVQRESPVPVFCIGGIKRENLHEVVAAGARRVVVVTGLLHAGDIAGYAGDCRVIMKA